MAAASDSTRPFDATPIFMPVPNDAPIGTIQRASNPAFKAACLEKLLKSSYAIPFWILTHSLIILFALDPLSKGVNALLEFFIDIILSLTSAKPGLLRACDVPIVLVSRSFIVLTTIPIFINV